MTTADFAIDLEIDFEEAQRVELVHPATEKPLVDDKGEPFWIKCRSAQSETFQRSLHEINGRYAVIASKNKFPNKGRLTYQQNEKKVAEIYASTMVDWHLGPKSGAKAWTFPCDHDTATKWAMASAANKVLRRQLESVTDDLTEFLDDAEGNDGGSPSADASMSSSDS